MRISVDAMGGDYAPKEIVRGALDAATTINGLEKLFLVGDEQLIQIELDKSSKEVPDCIEIISATEVVEMGEAPASAIRKKKDSSISRAIDLVKDGKADAIFSAGNTGAAVAAATLKLRTLEGVNRPAIATVMPTSKDPFVLLDAGANTDSTPEMLQQFAVMGKIYCKEILGVQSPRIGLLSIGEEEAKGNETTKKSFNLLAVLDWELSTLGDPRADLAAQIMQWSMPVGEEGRGLDRVKREELAIPEDMEFLEEFFLEI